MGAYCSFPRHIQGIQTRGNVSCWFLLMICFLMCPGKLKPSHFLCKTAYTVSSKRKRLLSTTNSSRGKYSRQDVNRQDVRKQRPRPEFKLSGSKSGREESWQHLSVRLQEFLTNHKGSHFISL